MGKIKGVCVSTATLRMGKSAGGGGVEGEWNWAGELGRELKLL